MWLKFELALALNKMLVQIEWIQIYFIFFSSLHQDIFEKQELPGGLRLPVTMSNNEGRVKSYKVSTEKTIQPRRQGAYKHPKTCLPEKCRWQNIKGDGLRWGWEWNATTCSPWRSAELNYCSWSSGDEMMAWLLVGMAWPCLTVLLAW